MSQVTETTENKIFEQFDRLGVSTNQPKESGLMCGNVSNITSRGLFGGEIAEPVTIYDDQGTHYYDGIKLLEFLKSLSIASLDDETDNIWYLITPFEI